MLTRGTGSNGNRGNGPGGARTKAATDATRQAPADGAEAANEAALGAWVGAALVGIVGGLGIAKYAQAWAGATLHPAALVGAVVVILSVGLAAVASGRYLQRAANLAHPGTPPRSLATLGLVLVTLLAWLALAIIAFAGWEFPPARQPATPVSSILDRPALLTAGIVLDKGFRRVRLRHAGAAVGRPSEGSGVCDARTGSGATDGGCPPRRDGGATGQETRSLIPALPSFGSAAPWWYGWLAVLVSALLLAACAQTPGTPTPNPAALPAGEVGCFTDLRVVPAGAAPPLTQADAEASARAQAVGRPRRLGRLLAARAVTVLPGEGRPGVLGGRDVWLLTFESSPSPDWPLPPSPAATTRAYVLVAPQTRNVSGHCTTAR